MGAEYVRCWAYVALIGHVDKCAMINVCRIRLVYFCQGNKNRGMTTENNTRCMIKRDQIIEKLSKGIASLGSIKTE